MLGLRRPSSSLRSKTPSLKRPWHLLTLIVTVWSLWYLANTVSRPHEPSLARDIKLLHKQAENRHKAMLSRQSTSLEEAQAEYRRRYEMEPPPGYDVWFQFATTSATPIIDDYDDLMSDLRPYRKFQEAGCDQNSEGLYSTELIRVCIIDKLVGVEGSQNPVVQPLLDVMNGFLQQLPNLCFTINTLDQPRTVVGHAMLSSLYGPTPPETCEVQHFRDMSKLDVWAEITQSCSHSSSARSSLARKNPGMVDLISDWTQATDLCASPQSPPSGLISSPEHMRLSNVVRPILSSSKLSTFQDVRFPSAKHLLAAAEPSQDRLAWEKKKPALFWRGDSSGGWASALNFRGFQRQRMVALAVSQDKAAAAAPTRTQIGLRSEPKRPASPLREHLDVGFTNFTSCDDGAREAMTAELGLMRATTLAEVFDNTLVLSMDGAGADPDLYRLLKSNSAVVRQGVVQEWHESRLLPWLHYVPLSMGMDELPGLLGFLTGEGAHLAREIAAEGRRWAESALRQEDMAVYIYRMLIEMARREF